MKKMYSFLIVPACLLSSCATIVSKTVYPVRIDSNPEKANIVVVNRNGKEVYSGLTPANISLPSGAGFFKKAIYTVTFNKAGYKERTIEVTATLNGWYFGNVVFGGVLGFLVIDPATGAMYRLNDVAIEETLEEVKDVTKQTHTLHIKDINTIPETWKKALVKI